MQNKFIPMPFPVLEFYQYYWKLSLNTNLGNVT